MMVGAAADGGHIILAGRVDTPRRQRGVRRGRQSRSASTSARRRSGSATTAPCRPTTTARTYKMIRESLLDPLGEDQLGRVIRIKGELGYAEAADDYERELRAVRPAAVRPHAARDRTGRSHALPVPGSGDASTSAHGSSSASRRPDTSRSCRGCRCRSRAVGLARHAVLLAITASRRPRRSPPPSVRPWSRTRTCPRRCSARSPALTVLIDPAAAARL